MAKEILSAPMIFRVKSESPYCLNSETMLSYLKTQTITIEAEIISCDNIKIFNMELFFLKIEI